MRATNRYVKISGDTLTELRETRRAQTRPYLTAYLSVEQKNIYLTIRNVGHTAALNVNFKYPESLSNLCVIADAGETLIPAALKTGIASFPPQQKYRTALKRYPDFTAEAKAKEWERQWDFQITYQDHQTQEVHSETMRLDLTQFIDRGSSRPSIPPDPDIYHIVTQLQRIEEAIIDLRDT